MSGNAKGYNLLQPKWANGPCRVPVVPANKLQAVLRQALFGRNLRSWVHLHRLIAQMLVAFISWTRHSLSTIDHMGQEPSEEKGIETCNFA